VQWLALAAAVATLWRRLFSHNFRYEYVATYTSRSMELRYVLAGLWGGQEGTFLLWALVTCSLGLVMMRVKHPLTTTAMFFLNLPLVIPTLVSFIPWLSNAALLHGLLVQRVTGSLRRTNFFLAVTSYVLVLYASFLTRSGVLADFSVHSFVNLGLNGFLLSFLLLMALVGYGALLTRLRDIPGPA